MPCDVRIVDKQCTRRGPNSPGEAKLEPLMRITGGWRAIREKTYLIGVGGADVDDVGGANGVGCAVIGGDEELSVAIDSRGGSYDVGAW